MLTFKEKALGIAFSLLALFALYMFAVTGTSNANAQKLADMKVQEVTAEAQIQQWMATKTAATKEILRLNGELAKEAQGQGLKTMPTQK